jgi:hypothetical protein
MSNSPVKTTTPADFIVLKSYTANDVTTVGDFPIYITGVSECCLDDNGNQKVVPLVIPKK